ncbi:RHS repeat-associated core domain-containing protein [Fontisubflavum oceani]|uniref:RHS repeat-associated core domain-containing protein n=1 Tax=Fontisubflavum oceani TaxID=2978973 RepID=UPI0025B2C4A9|nr:RHS repeat-associated core domain-containing protein [Fontisubflavum oceani]WJY20394.1 RHS repeat-associated core domain-containing protein [Fontisubflavum oceani]
MTDATGARAEARVYAPFGEIAWRDGGTSPDETFGYIGERYDSDAGLQYLNARYYDPRLAMFIQPDWFEVTEPGVGTNRYAYSANDPINHMDPEGNAYSRSDRAQEVLDNYLEHSEEFGHARDQFGSVGSGVSGTIAAKNRAAGLSGRFTFDARGNWTSSVRGGLDVTMSTNGGLRGIARSGPLVSVLDGQRPTLGASGGGIVVGGGGFAIAMWLRDVFTRSPADVGSTATRRQYSNVMRFQIQGTALGRHQQRISLSHRMAQFRLLPLKWHFRRPSQGSLVGSRG